MLRRVQAEGWAVSRAAETFGLSRPSFYKAQQAFEQAGLSGLVRQKPGPKSGHKLSDEVMAFIAANLQEQPALSAGQLAQRVARQFNRSVHPRSIERALRRQEKNAPRPRDAIAAKRSSDPTLRDLARRHPGRPTMPRPRLGPVPAPRHAGVEPIAQPPGWRATATEP